MSARNPFINVSVKNLWKIEDEADQISTIKKIHSKALFYQKEYALDTTLLVESFIKWKAPDKENYFISPLLYRTAKVVLNRKIEAKYQLKEISEECFVNPILKHAFTTYFNVSFSDQVDEPEAFYKWLKSEFDQGENGIVELDSFNENQQWELIKLKAVGNFNYKKSLLGADYERFYEEPGEQISSLLSGNRFPNDSEEEDAKFINTLDASQKEAVLKAIEGNLVIQGPPGTGKSHTIVSLIASYLLQGKKILFVSEKRSALDVVFERLKEKKLHYWTAYFNTEKDEKKAFYSHLGSAWDQIIKINLDKQKTDQAPSSQDNIFSKYPGLLLQENENIGGSLAELNELLVDSDVDPKEVKISGLIPKYAEWKKHLNFLRELEEKVFNEIGIKTLSEAGFLKLNRSLFKEDEPVLYLEKRLGEIGSTLDQIQKLQKKYSWSKTFDEFTRSAISASILNMVNRNQLDLLNKDSKAYKSFGNWAKKYEVTKNKLTHLEKANKKWSKKPSIAEITELTDLLKHNEAPKGVFGFLRRNPEKLKTAFKDFDPGISKVAKLQLLESVREEWHLKSELDEIMVKLSHNLNITNPEQEIEQIIRLRNKLDEVGENDYIRILENENSLEMIADLEKIHPAVQQANQQSRFIFNANIPDNIAAFSLMIVRLQKQLQFINQRLPEIRKFYEISQGIIDLLNSNEEKVENLNIGIAYQNILDHTRFETLYKKFNGWDLKAEYKKLKSEENLWLNLNREIIRTACAEQIKTQEDLLNTPASKLSEKEKEYKKAYRKHKRTLIHEINKKQQHLAVKTLFDECSETLLKIQPVWMMNPLAISGSLPCDEGLFDVVIFDESSQIPLEDAIPAIFRSKQVIVVGDSNQMPPSQFFTHRADTRTLLDQAEFAYDNKMLKWHYRSEHPALIRFSNRHFYENELTCLPPVRKEIPIEHFKVNGIFEDGKNLEEATEIVNRYKAILKNGEKDVGIIAFSREQERAIEQELNKQKVPLNDDLLLRNLENVQGVEKNIILISFGYGPNEDGVFRMNFGPVNQENGANRLNVLFTRAIQKMIVLSSVSSNDFKLSDNRGVQLMKDFLYYVENISQSSEQVSQYSTAHKKIADLIREEKLIVEYYGANERIAVSCFVQHDKNRILLVDPGHGESETRDIYNLLSIFDSKYDDFLIILSQDIWGNYDRVRKEVVSFFS